MLAHMGVASAMPTARQRDFRSQPAGGLPASVYELLEQSGVARGAAIDAILGRFFDDGVPGALLQAVGLFDDEVARDLVGPSAPSARGPAHRV